MTTKTKRITLGGIGFVLAYSGYVYLNGFHHGSIHPILNAISTILSGVANHNHTLALIWIISIGVLSFCKLFGIDYPVLYGCWCVVRAFFKLFKDLFGWAFLKKSNPFT